MPGVHIRLQHLHMRVAVDIFKQVRFCIYMG